MTSTLEYYEVRYGRYFFNYHCVQLYRYRTCTLERIHTSTSLARITNLLTDVNIMKIKRFRGKKDERGFGYHNIFTVFFITVLGVQLYNYGIFYIPEIP